MQEHHGLWLDATFCKNLFLTDESIAQDHCRSWEIADHKFVALLGNLRSGSDVDDKRNALLLSNLSDGAGRTVRGRRPRSMADGKKLAARCEQPRGSPKKPQGPPATPPSFLIAIWSSFLMSDGG